MKLVAPFLVVLSIGTACSNKKKDPEDVAGTEALVKVEMTNGTSLTQLTDMAPTIYGEKFWHISLRGKSTLADGAVVDTEAVIWGNEACSFPTMQMKQPHSVEPDDYTVLFEYNTIADVCTSNEGTYINLAQDSATVNAEFNAQDYPVPPGTFDRISLNGLANTNGRTQWRFQAGDMTAPVEVVSRAESSLGLAGGIEVKLAAPIEIKEGEKVTVSVTYDLSSAIGYGPYGSSTASGGDNCYTVTSSNTEYCVNPIVVTPNATKN